MGGWGGPGALAHAAPRLPAWGPAAHPSAMSACTCRRGKWSQVEGREGREVIPPFPSPRRSPHHDANKEGDAQEQASPGHQEGIGGCHRVGTGFHDSPCSRERGLAPCGDEGPVGPGPRQPTHRPFLTTSAISSIFPEELGGQRDPIGAILHGGLQEKGGRCNGMGQPPHSAFSCPTQGHDIQPGTRCIPLGLRPCPTCELKGPISEVRSLGSARAGRSVRLGDPGLSPWP